MGFKAHTNLLLLSNVKAKAVFIWIIKVGKFYVHVEDPFL